MEEIWREIPGFEGIYQASNTQKVKSLERLVSRKDGKTRIQRERIMHPADNGIGYLYVNLNKDGKKEKAYIHQIMAKTFPELVQNEWFEGAEIDHIDTNPQNNDPANLKWVDRKGQYKNNLTKQHLEKSVWATGMFVNRKDLSKWVIKLSTNNEILHFYPSIQEASRETNIPAPNIHKCLTGKRNSAGGFAWKYAE